jgi:Flp pilus assembly pilin Flp
MTKSILACDEVRDVSMIRAFFKDEGGGPAAEFTMVMFALITLTLAIIDFGRATWVWNAAQKATQVAARIAVVRDPLYLPIKYHFVCNPPDTIVLGKLCLDPATNTIRPDCDFGTVVCTKDGCNGQPYDTEQAQKFAEIYDAMLYAYPWLEDNEVSITYTPTELGFVGKPGGPIAEVRAAITGDTFFFYGLMTWGFLAMNMQEFRTTLTSEDMSDNSLIEQGLVKNQTETPVCS